MDVGGWLRNLGLGQYEAMFRENEIDTDVLPELTEIDLEKLGVPLGHRKRLRKAIAGLGAAEKLAATLGPAPVHPHTDAAEQGTVLHHCVRTLLLRPDLSEALFSSVGVSFPEETKTAIKQSASGLRALLDRLGITIIGTEVPILAKRRD